MKYTDEMLREGSLSDKDILITGGGSGLGKSMASYFMKLGARVVITSRNLEKLRRSSKELEEQTGGTCIPVQCDERN